MSISGLKKLEDGTLHSVWYIHDQGIKLVNGNTRLKSGISSLSTPKGYTSQTIRNEGRGKVYIKWEDNFIDQNLTFDQAGKIIPLMDNTFKSIMIQEGYNARAIYNDRSIGTEYYEATDRNELIEVIESTWEKSYKIAYEFVTKKELPDSLWIEEFKSRKGQDTKIINPTVDFFKENNKGTWQIPGGSGKTKCSLVVSNLVCDYTGIPWKVLMTSDTIANTCQLVVEYAKFYKGQKGRRNMNIYAIGSISPEDYRMLESWANVIPASEEEKIEEMLIQCNETNQDCAIFIVNKSANRVLRIADKAGVNFNSFFTILDEIQQYCSESDIPKRVNSPACSMIDPAFDHLFGKKLGVTATMICRGNDPSTFSCYNDDIDKFGSSIVNIDEIQARQLGWICEKEGMIIPIPHNERFMESFEQKRPFQMELGEQIFNIHVSHYVAVEGTVKFILPQNKSHIILLSPFIKDIEELAKLFKQFQSLGIIDSEYEIIEGYSKCGLSCVNRFNRAEKAIMIATRWVGVGQDTYKCDCVFPLYNPGNVWFLRQTSMRGDRVWGDKISLLVFVEIESRLHDNIWFRSLNNIANGIIPNIISEAEFRETNPLPLIGSRTNPRDGEVVNAGTGANITIVRPRNYDPILFARWEELANSIARRNFIDRDGNSRFSDIVKNNDKKNLAERYFKEIKERHRNRKNRSTRNSIRATNDFYYKDFHNLYGNNKGYRNGIESVKEAKKLLKPYIKEIENIRRKEILEIF